MYLDHTKRMPRPYFSNTAIYCTRWSLEELHIFSACQTHAPIFMNSSNESNIAFVARLQMLNMKIGKKHECDTNIDKVDGQKAITGK